MTDDRCDGVSKTGLQAQNVNFTNPTNYLHSALLFLHYSLCTLMDLPVTVQPCLPPKDCQVSEWTEWSPCSETCTDFNSSRGSRTRKRQVLRLSAGEELDCPPLEKTESCQPPGETSIPCAKLVFLINTQRRLTRI